MPYPSILTIIPNTLEQDKLSTALKKIGYTHIITADSANSGWAVLKTTDVGCVIAAYNISDISGLALLKFLKKEERFADLPVFLTDSAFTKIKVIKAGQAGVSGLFVIPYNPKALKMRLATALGKLKDPVIHQVELNVKKGLELIEKKEYKKALGVFETLVIEKENPEFYYNIGYIKTAQNKHYEAIEAFSKATRLDRLFVKAYKAMAVVYRAMGAAEKVEECTRIAVEIYMDTDKLGKAEDMLNELLASGTDSLNVFNTLGVLYRKKGDIKEAMKQYKKALKVHPDEPYIYYNIGRLYLDAKNTTKAKTYFQAALDKDHGFNEAKQVIKAIDLGMI
ncbi:tetratricopeptide repeat protein [Desulfobacter latus]|uniref:Tetratricopeptide repeat protein n=1 Tax=Desulfobacter latus TaxID=2292 RepID=A0A850TBD5_9BACT|nr:tetratricopeptide repeat protein [Desulfobacter latus]NWH05948.1 tetratricopeptide repeat protein [Desulfobacter latus]